LDEGTKDLAMHAEIAAMGSTLMLSDVPLTDNFGVQRQVSCMAKPV
jgi:uncharacterized glyoxalase superfamily protein PhnB